MSAAEFITYLARLGVELRRDGDLLRYRARKGALTAELRADLEEHKSAILLLLAGEADDAEWVHRFHERAGVLEFDANLDRDLAERLAFDDCVIAWAASHADLAPLPDPGTGRAAWDALTRAGILALRERPTAPALPPAAERMAALVRVVSAEFPGCSIALPSATPSPDGAARIACATCGESTPTYGGAHPSCASCTYGKGYSATSAGARAALESRGIATAATLAAWPEIGRRPRRPRR